MTATILKGDYGHVDFVEPVEMTPKQFELFMKHLPKIFDRRIIMQDRLNSETMRELRLGEYFPSETWAPCEYEILLEPFSTEKKSELLGRSFMSVRMQETAWLPEYFSWRQKHPELKHNDIELIKLFLKEQEIEKLKAREKRKNPLLLQCTECGTYHDPRNKTLTFCNICAENLREVHVSKAERRVLYLNQPESNRNYLNAIQEMLKKYPYKEDED